MTVQDIQHNWQNYEFIACDGRITLLKEVFCLCRRGRGARELIFTYKDPPDCEMVVKIDLDGRCHWAGDSWECIGRFRKIEHSQ